MPKRTKEERRAIDKLPVRAASTNCNARTPNGYCKNVAGFRTSHVGSGRCYLHGGVSASTVSRDIYGVSLSTTTLSENYEMLANDPMLVDLRAELASQKAVLSNLLKTLSEKLELGGNPFVGEEFVGENMKKVISPEARLLFQGYDIIGKTYTRIINAEKELSKSLEVKEIHAILIQFKETLDAHCGNCPVRKHLVRKIKKIRLPE